MSEKSAKMAPKIDPGAVGARRRPKKHPRAASRDQREAKTGPRAPQERRTAIFSIFPAPGEPRFWIPGVALQSPGSGFGGGGLLKQRFRMGSVANFLFFQGPRENGLP